MKLVYFLTLVLALSLAEEDQKYVKRFWNSEDYEPETQSSYVAPAAATYVSPSQRERNWQTNQAIKEQNSWTPEVQNDYYWGSTSAPEQYKTSTTPVPVIKNEFYLGDNGDYKYEYQIADGTSVGEQGYFSDPNNKNEESLVKKGWYSFLGADGITYTVTYWADHTGYHAYGSHLPSVSTGNTVNTPQQGSNVYPTQTAAPTTQRPTYTYKPIYNSPQQTYNPPQQTYNPPQQTYNPPQQTYNPPQPTYNPPQQQQIYYPTQQPIYNRPQKPTYNQQQQQYYYN